MSVGHRRAILAVAVVAVVGVVVPPSSEADQATTLVFVGEGNRQRVYDAADPSDTKVLVPSVGDEPATGRDLNAQICFHESGGSTYMIAGEDSGQGNLGSPGWGWFEIAGDDVAGLTATQVGKLRPTWSPHAGDGQAENYGCGFLPDGRLVTSDVGRQLPHEDASGQLLVWYPDGTGGFADATVPGGDWSNVDNTLDHNYCKIETRLGTGGGVMVDDGWVYVTANRPGPIGPGGIYRYEIAEFPATNDCDGDGDRDADDEVDLAAAGEVTRELWLPSDAHVLTPSAVVPSGSLLGLFPTYYVSSVFTGVIAEYADLGPVRVHLRNVVEPPAGAPLGMADFADIHRAPAAAGAVGVPPLPGADQLPPIPEPVRHLNDGGTPFGLGVTPDGDLWYADLGIVLVGPAPDFGSVQRVTFDDLGTPDRTVIEGKQNFTDGIGVLTLP